MVLKKDERVGLSSEGLNPSDPDVNSSSTIAAIVTSLGGQASAVGIIRLSGPSAVEIAGRVFRPSKRREKDLSWQPTSHVVEYGVVCDSHGNVVDEVKGFNFVSFHCNFGFLDNMFTTGCLFTLYILIVTLRGESCLAKKVYL